MEIRPVRQTDLDSFCAANNSICRERRYLATVEGFSPEQFRARLGPVVDKGLPSVVAVDGDHVVGFCNILPCAKTGFTHVGELAMGVVREYRSRGLGRRLLTMCLALARDAGLEKVELQVFADNEVAARLYESVGFEYEGCKKRARKLDGQYQDIQLMALQL